MSSRRVPATSSNRFRFSFARRSAASRLAVLLAAGLALLLAATLSSGAAAATTRGPIALGAYANGFTGAGTQLSQFESEIGAKVAIASSFRGWGDVFPDSTQLQDANSGHTMLIAWDLGATSATNFLSFVQGKHNSYLAQEVAAAKKFGKTFYVRPWAEMNGDWQPFQPTAPGATATPAGGTYGQFIAAWRYVVTYFRNHGATNVKWVFNPTTDTYAETTPVSSIFPGAAYVDVLGLDGYNWGTGGVFSWQSFASIYNTQYQRLTSLDPSAPVWVCEFASKEPTENDGAPVDPAHTKSAWYQDMFSYVQTTATKISAVVFFDMNKERDWRLGSSGTTVSTVSTQARSASPSVVS